MRKIFILFNLLLVSFFCFSQNPFAQYGYETKVATYSNGKFNESYDETEVVEIGSARYNTTSKAIVGIVERTDSIAYDVSPTTISRFISIDPLCEKFPSISPYAFCNNNPLVVVDQDGRVAESIWDAINFGLGITNASNNISAGNWGAAAVDVVGIVVDAAATLVPGVPGGAATLINTVRATDKATDVARTIDKAATARGIKNEAKVLKEMGLEKNTKTFSAKDPSTGISGKVIPDAVDSKTVYEIKDTKTLNNTAQIRREREAAKSAGKDYKIITGTNTHVSKKIPPEDIIRRDDLGPQTSK